VKERSGGKDLGDAELVDLFRGFVIFIEPARKADAEKVARDVKPAHAAVGYFPEEKKAEAVQAYEPPPEAKNTVYLYNESKVVATFVDLTEKDFDRVLKAAADMLKNVAKEPEKK